jgi:hypothetical protein
MVSTQDIASLSSALAGFSVEQHRVDLWTIVHAAHATGGDDFAAIVALSPSLQDCRHAAGEYRAIHEGAQCAVTPAWAAAGITCEDVTAAVLWRGKDFCEEFLGNPFLMYAVDVRLYPGRAGFVARALSEFSWCCFGEDVMKK